MTVPAPDDTGLLRPQTGPDAHRVTYVELFFDLVFVFAITQISHGLIAHPDLTTLAQTLILVGAVWWIWVDTAWVTNWLNPNNGRVRGMMFVLMLLGLVLASAIPEAFGDKALLFVLTMVLIQVGRAAFTAAAMWNRWRDNAIGFARIATWGCVSGVFWIAGALVDEQARVLLWLLAVLIDFSGPRARFWVPGIGATALTTWVVRGEHMAERVSLFFIIVLGESIIVTGSTLAELPLDTTTILAFLAAFASTVLMWLLYFNHGEQGGSEYISKSAGNGLIAQIAYTYIPLLLVWGILLTAVADELVLLHPLGHEHDGHLSGVSDLWTNGLICGASAIYLIGNLLFKRAIGVGWLYSHAVGAAALIALTFTYAFLSPLAVSWLANLVLLLVVIADEVGYRRRSRLAAPVSAA